jgi:hypothetical protein
MRDLRECRLGLISLSLVCFQIIPCAAFDLRIASTSTAPTIQWDAAFAHEYQVVRGQSADHIDTLHARILTATDTNFLFKPPEIGQRVNLFKTFDLGWTFKVMDLTNNAAGHAFITWSSETDKLYRVVRTTNLSDSPDVLGTDIAGQPPVNVFTDATATALDTYYYYWVEEQTNGGFLRTVNAGSFCAISLAKGVGTVRDLFILHRSFESFDGQPRFTPSEILGNQLALSATCSIYRTESNDYTAENFTGAGWTPNTNELLRGRGFWINVKHTNMVLYLYGEIPDSRSAPTTSILIHDTNFTLTGYPYPITIQWTNTSLASNSCVGDWVYWWVVTQEQFSITMRLTNRWSKPLVLTPGMGFYYSTTQSQVWVETKPYSWP